MKFFYCLFFMILLSSCCTKKDCINTFDSGEIDFYGFTAAEADTFFIYAYEKNTHFMNATDSEILWASGNNTDYVTVYSSMLDLNKDFRIVVPQNGVYNLSGFETEKTGCNQCFPFRPESDYYTQLSGYYVNGQHFQGRNLKIYK